MKQARIAYLVKTFPRLSETFILNEILGLEKLGLKLHIYALRRPGQEAVHPKVAEVKAPVTYVPGVDLWKKPAEAARMAAAHAAMAALRPDGYRGAWRLHKQQAGARLKDFLQAGYLAAEMQRWGETHLHAHFANLPASVAEGASRMSGVPFSFTAHAKDIYLTGEDELRRKIDHAQFVMTCTGYNAEFLRGLGGDAPVHLAYHGVDVSLFRAAGESEGAEAETPLILSVGRFCEKKGFPTLIEACRLLRDRGRRFECRIVGYGPMEQELRRQIAEAGLEATVTLPGQKRQTEVAELYRQARMFVLPCQVNEDGDRDGIPNVLLEAMASGLPVVSTPVSGITELIEAGVNGLLAKERDAESLAGAMEWLLSEKEMGRRMGRRGRETVLSRFELEASARRVHGILAREGAWSEEAAEVTDARAR